MCACKFAYGKHTCVSFIDYSYKILITGAVMGLRLKVRANENLLYSEIEGLVLMKVSKCS